MQPYKCSLYDRPGLSWTSTEIRSMVAALRTLASTCFSSLPDYQCLSISNPRCLDDKILVVARHWDTDEIVGFVSAVYYEVPDVGTVIHSGLTCTHPSVRRSGVSIFLYYSLLIPHVLCSYPKGIWISTLSEIPITLVGPLLVTTNAFPSRQLSSPSETHIRIAKTLTTSYRHHINAPREAELDISTFMFRNSRPLGSPFRADPFDPALQHRDEEESKFYLSMLKKEGGDDVLQVAFLDPVKASKRVQSKLSIMMSSVAGPENLKNLAKL